MDDNILTISGREIELLDKIKQYLVGKVKLPELGRYKNLSDEDIWFQIVGQLCVMGGVRMFENLDNDEVKKSEFKKEICFKNILLINRGKRERYIDSVLQKFKVTRFHLQQARRLNRILDEPEIVKDRSIVLLKGLSHTQSFREIRNRLMERNQCFKLKSASDFMISVGLSHNVIALDIRIVGILNRYFNINLDANKIQSNKPIYESIEDSLRNACAKIGISLAHLDRMLFRFSSKNVIAFILEDL